MDKTQLAGEIGGRVRAARLAQRWTQEELGEAAGLLVPHVCRLEKGLKLPLIGTLLRLADALGISVRELIPETKPPRRRKLVLDPGPILNPAPQHD